MQAVVFDFGWWCPLEDSLIDAAQTGSTSLSVDANVGVRPTVCSRRCRSVGNLVVLFSDDLVSRDEDAHVVPCWVDV